MRSVWERVDIDWFWATRRSFNLWRWSWPGHFWTLLEFNLKDYSVDVLQESVSCPISRGPGNSPRTALSNKTTRGYDFKDIIKTGCLITIIVDRNSGKTRQVLSSFQNVLPDPHLIILNVRTSRTLLYSVVLPVCSVTCFDGSRNRWSISNLLVMCVSIDRPRSITSERWHSY